MYLLSLTDYAELESLLAALREAGVAVEELALQEADLEHGIPAESMARHQVEARK